MTDPLSKNLQVVVLGGYGFFGSRIVRLLAREAGLTVMIAGRDRAQAEALKAQLSQNSADYPARVQALRLDVQSADFPGQLAELGPAVVIHTCGPFQGQDYAVARACIDAGCHYIDLADGREFVQGIDILDALARERGVLVCSGASSVCGLSGAVVDAAAAQFQKMDSVDIWISPGNKTDRGLATVQGIVSYCGEPIPLYQQGRQQRTIGWGSAERVRFADPIGPRWVSDCDVPDSQVLPVRYPELQSVRFQAGLELALLHWGMVVLAWLRRWHLAPNWARFARQLKWLSERFLAFGSTAGAMAVRVSGIDHTGQDCHQEWHLIALDGDGPFVPALCSVALVRRLLREGCLPAGAMPAPAGLTLAEIEQTASGLAITLFWR